MEIIQIIIQIEMQPDRLERARKRARKRKRECLRRRVLLVLECLYYRLYRYSRLSLATLESPVEVTNPLVSYCRCLCEAIHTHRQPKLPVNV